MCLIELGQLEAHGAEFARRNTRIVAVSLDSRDDAAKTKNAVPHLSVVADAEGNLCSTADVMGPQSGPSGDPAAAPTTILVDRRGIVRWIYRPARYLVRLSPGELLAAVDTHLVTTQ